MHARITRYKMKPASTEAATKLLNELKSEIMALPGIRHFYNVMDENGAGYVISFIEPSEVASDSPERVKAIWAKFGDMLEAMPTPETYGVIADWS
jgi:hypothetical protein